MGSRVGLESGRGKGGTPVIGTVAGCNCCLPIESAGWELMRLVQVDACLAVDCARLFTHEAA